jgi:CRISPR-associated endonuclease/helicase Cas3
MPEFEAFFHTATGHRPHGYLARIAKDGLPAQVQMPAAAAKTELILAWLWRRLHGPDPAVTPRRLLYVLPPGALPEAWSGSLRAWLARLELADQVAVHVVRGGSGENTGDWRENMHQPAIVLGEADLLVSKALNRGYGTGRALYPVDFALVCNGAQWIVDEPARCQRAVATLRQLAGQVAVFGTAEPFAVTCRTAADPGGWRHADRSAEPGDDAGEPGDSAEPGDYPALAAFAAASHRAGTLTLVEVDRGAAAREVYRPLRDGPARCVLLHAQFRGIERSARAAEIVADPVDLIVVSAGKAVSGLGLTPAVVVTETAPRPTPAPRSGQPAVLPEGPLAREIPDLITLFDTAPVPPDPAGLVDGCLRDGGQPDVELAWVTWTAGPDGAPDPEVRYPAPEYRCRVSVSEALELAESRPVWRFNRAAGEWQPLTRLSPTTPGVPTAPGVPRAPDQSVASDESVASEEPVASDEPVAPGEPLEPYELLLVDAAAGGYDPETGFDPRARMPVPDSPEVLTPAERTERTEHAERAERAERAAIAAAAAAPEQPGPAGPARSWQSLSEHSERVRDQAAALLAFLAPALPPVAARAAVLAGYLHDVGKAHPVWQDALCALAGEADAATVAAGRPWAKSGTDGRLEFAGGVAFRHELASLLLIDGPLRPLLAMSPDPDLTRYLVLAHHGLLRVQVRDPATPAAAGHAGQGVLLGLEHGATTGIPPVLGQPGSTLSVDLGQFCPGGDRSWSESVRALLGRYGPFTLAYLEAIVRIADWRASGGRELPSADR